MRIRSSPFLAWFWVTLAALFTGFQCSAAQPVVMKVLVLAGSANEGSYRSITTVLDQVGVPYQAKILGSLTADASGNRMPQIPLIDTVNARGLYQGIIISDTSFSTCGPSCLSTADWNTIKNYAALYGVRVASYFTAPTSDWGLVAGATATYTSAAPLSLTLTSAGATTFPYLNATTIFTVAGQGTAGVRAYLASPVAGTNETTTPLMVSGANTVAVIHTTADGRETMSLTMDNDPSLVHSAAFGYGVINWVTKGIFLGSRRVFLNPQFDDLLIGNWLYSPSRHPACEANNSCPTYFATSPDLMAMATWQAGLQSDPLFQGYKTAYAYNGVGTTWFDPNDPIFAAIKSFSNTFWWLSHTWDHANLDCYSFTQAGACIPATQAQSLAELTQNINVAPQLGVTLDRLGMVTPFNSGLNNANFLRAAVQAGLKYIVIPQMPSSPNTPIVSSLVPAVTLLTRMNNNVFDDASTPQTGVPGSWPDEYNDHYGPRGSTPLYSQNLSYVQIVDVESQSFLQTNLLTYAPYFLPFHIANAATYDGVHSIYTDVMDAMITKYKKLFTLPVVSLTMEDAGTYMANRAAYNASGVVGVYTPGVGVTLTTTKAATIPLTGLCAQASCGSYGGQIQDSVVMAANSSVTIPLTSTSGVTLSSLTSSASTVQSGASISGTVVLSGPAPTGGISVNLSSSSSAATVPTSLTVPSGASAASFVVTGNSVSVATSAVITASYGGLSRTIFLSVTPIPATLTNITIAPASVTNGAAATGTVSLSQPAPVGGITVALSSSAAFASVPATLSIPAGSSGASFAISTSTVTSSSVATVSGTYAGVTKTASLTVTPTIVTAALSSVTLSSPSVVGGSTLTGTITLTAAAPSAGAVITLASSSTLVTPASTITIASGALSATFAITTSTTTASATALITATYAGVSKTASLAITPTPALALSSISLSPVSINSGSVSTGTVTLSGTAPVGGAVVTISSSNTGAVTSPASVTVAAGASSATFSLTAKTVAATTAVTISSSYAGVTKTATLTVTPNTAVSLASVSVSPASVVNQATATGTVTLSAAAPAGGISVALWTTGAIAYVPASVTVPAGATTATFTITTNYTQTTKADVVTAFYNGASKTAAVIVTP